MPWIGGPMDASSIDHRLDPAYEMLLATLCQHDLASAWGPCMPVSDPNAARLAVVTWASAFGGEVVRALAAMLDCYVDHARLRTPLVPLVCDNREFDSILH